MEGADTHASPATHLNAFEVFLKIREAQRERRPAAVIRLGDGEGAVLGYPETTSRADVERFCRAWLRRADVSDPELFSLRDQLRLAIGHADILGVPRPAQVCRDRLWAVAGRASADIGVGAEPTYTALHRLMSHALLFRPLLRDQPFVGLISCRDVGRDLRRLFGVRRTRWYGVRGGRDEPGAIETPHWPEGFEEIRSTLEVPSRGALFLVGAGVFGKIYCHWIKQRGGIGIDIGSIFDSWAGVGRVGHPVRGLGVYEEHPAIAREAAVVRYNDLLRAFDLDVPEAAALDALPEAW